MDIQSRVFILVFASWSLTCLAGSYTDSYVVSPGDKVRIAMCQIFCLDSDREGNYVRIENALKKARELDVDIACFPETSLLGWVNPIAHDIAEPIPGIDSARLCALAAKHKIYIYIGLAEKSEDRLYDSAV